MNEQVGELLKEMAAKLGTTSEYLWAVLVRGTWAEGIAQTALGVVLILVAAAGAYALKRGLKMVNDYSGDEDSGFALAIVGGVALLVGSIIGVAALYDGVIAVAAPEYSALKTIIGSLTK